MNISLERVQGTGNIPCKITKLSMLARSTWEQANSLLKLYGTLAPNT